tara:strand:+ start:154 stop:255 length:102 start_codon:yes stop_codon:yes gene_type:complete
MIILISGAIEPIARTANMIKIIDFASHLSIKKV